MRILKIAAAAMLILPCAGPAAAQFDPGTTAMLAVMAASQGAAEQACLEGRPLDPDRAADIDRRSQKRLDEYFAAIAASDASEVARLFIDHGRRASWTGPDGPLALKEIKDPYALARGTAPLVRKAFIAGGDGETARGVWSLTLHKPGDPTQTQTVEYAADFELGAFGGYWLLHMHVFAGDGSAPLPTAYCHLTPFADLAAAPRH